MGLNSKAKASINEARKEQAEWAARMAAQDAAHDAEFAYKKRERISFLRSTDAIPTPMELYALWMAVWIEQGGKIYVSDGNFNTPATILNMHITGNGIVHTGAPTTNDRENTPGAPIDENYLRIDHWMPRTLHRIPAGYGANSMDIFLLGQQLPPATTHDSRPGWEWGHTTVRTLAGSDSSGLVALTNQKGTSHTLYADVLDLIDSHGSAQSLIAFIRSRFNSDPFDGLRAAIER